MAGIVNNFAIDHVLRGMMLSSHDNSYMWSVNQITNPQLSITSETGEAVDALGSRIAVFNRGKSAEFTAENSLFDLGLFAAQNGVDKQIASEEETISAPTFEEFVYDGSMTEYKLKHVPLTDLTAIYLENGDGTLGDSFKSNIAANNTSFVWDKEGNKITLPSGLEKGCTLFIAYDYAMESGVAVTGDAMNFPKAGRFILEVLGNDVCDQTVLIHAYLDFPNAKLDANVDINFTTEGTHPFTIQCQQSYCDPLKTLYRLLIPLEEEDEPSPPRPEEKPTGQKAISIPMGEDFGDAEGKSTDFCSDVNIAWTGTRGAVTGTFYKENPSKAYNLPLKISEYYSGKQITVGSSTQNALLWQVELSDETESIVTVKCGADTLATLKFTGATFKEGWSPTRLSGTDGAQKPEKTTQLLGDTTVEDLIGDDLALTYEDQKVKASGTIKTILEPWEDFSTENNTGHFFPLVLPKDCIGEVTCKGRLSSMGGDRTVTITDDRLLVTRMENLEGTSFSIEKDGASLEVDLSGLVPIGEKAYDAEKSDYGGYGQKAEMVEGLDIQWSGVKGTASGTLKKYAGTSSHLTQGIHYFPLPLAEWFDGVNKTVTCANSSTSGHKDWIMKIEDTKTIKVVYNGLTVMELDLSGMSLEE